MVPNRDRTKHSIYSTIVSQRASKTSYVPTVPTLPVLDLQIQSSCIIQWSFHKQKNIRSGGGAVIDDQPEQRTIFYLKRKESDMYCTQCVLQFCLRSKAPRAPESSVNSSHGASYNTILQRPRIRQSAQNTVQIDPRMLYRAKPQNRG